jgi:predicted nucleic acid-binding Zn ribbon protein
VTTQRNERAERNKGPEDISDILGRLFVARGWGRLSERTRLESAWQETSAEWPGQSRLLGLRRGVLEVEVRSGVLLQELAQFHKRKLLAELRKKLPGQTLTDIKFRAGVW